MKRIVLALVLLVSLAAPTWADFDEGLAAYKRGDYPTALREWRPLAEQGDAKAQLHLGNMYISGQGVPRDYAEAIKWLRKAAQQGHAGAQNSLGILYDMGLLVPRDYAEAVRWMRKAAEQGIAQAQYTLGVAYANGQGVVRDDAEALRWLRKAAAQGNQTAGTVIQWIEGIEERQRLAKERAKEGPPHERAEKLLEWAEALSNWRVLTGNLSIRDLKGASTRPLELGKELADADMDLEYYLTEHSNDVRALILSARIKIARISRKNRLENIRYYTLSRASAHLDRALTIEPDNAAIYYWKVRRAWTEWRGTWGVSDLTKPFQLKLIQLMRRAIELSPENSQYREALAAFLNSSGQYDEAMAALKEVAGGRHPISLLLADFSAFPLPPGAVLAPKMNAATAQGMALSMYLSKITSYQAFRQRVYVLPMSDVQAEIFYQEALPGGVVIGPNIESYSVSINGVELSDRPNEGLMVMITEISGAPPRTNKFGDLLHQGNWPTDVHAILYLLYLRDVTVR